MKQKMDIKGALMISSVMLILCVTPIYAQSSGSVIASPAPAPAPDYVNLTRLFTYDGPFQTFLKYLESTKLLDTFQNKANNTVEGITIFVPKDEAFASLKYPSLSNLSNDQLRSLLLFHALSRFYTLADFKNLSANGPVTTLAGGQYTLNITDVSGTVLINSGWSNTSVSSAVRSTDPVSVFQVDEVLLPEAIFGTNIPPPPPPSPPASTPASTPAAVAPAGSGSGKPSAPSSPFANSTGRIGVPGVFCYFVLALSGVVLLSL